MILSDKVALITGAATGIGCATAKLFAEEGAKVVVADIKEKESNETVMAIKEAGGEAVYVHADVSKMKNVEKMVAN